MKFTLYNNDDDTFTTNSHEKINDFINYQGIDFNMNNIQVDCNETFITIEFSNDYVLEIQL